MRWEERVQRAQDLQKEPSTAAAPLRFYEVVLGFQRDLARDFRPTFDPAIPLRKQIDPEFPSSRFPRLLALAVEHGPETLAVYARELQQAGAAEWRTILESALMADGHDLSVVDAVLARAWLQPIAECLQSQLPGDTNYSESLCPACGGLPQLSVLRPEGEGASRSLLCSFCLREWMFRRIICPWCREEDKQKLPRYSAEECAHVLVEACETCKRYLKAVDMSINGRAEPMVDEAAFALLDVWAVDHGYTKIVQNLVGF